MTTQTPQTFDPGEIQGYDERAYIRATHPYAFRSGEWARVRGVESVKVNDTWRVCYEVEFADGRNDYWPVEDTAAGYEWRDGFNGVRTKWESHD